MLTVLSRQAFTLNPTQFCDWPLTIEHKSQRPPYPSWRMESMVSALPSTSPLIHHRSNTSQSTAASGTMLPTKPLRSSSRSSLPSPAFCIFINPATINPGGSLGSTPIPPSSSSRATLCASLAPFTTTTSTSSSPLSSSSMPRPPSTNSATTSFSPAASTTSLTSPPSTPPAP